MQEIKNREISFFKTDSYMNLQYLLLGLEYVTSFVYVLV